MLDTCLFDLYGTLVDIRTEERMPELWEHMAGIYAKRGALYTPRELEEAYFGLIRSMESGEGRQDAHEAHPEIKIERVFRGLFEKKGVPADMDLAVETGREFRRASTLYICLYPGAAELLAALRGAGKRVYLLSNAQRIFTKPELSDLGIEGYFDGVYISSDYGVKKPDRRFFEIALKERRIDPDFAVMVGNDGLCDIAPARALGLRTLYIHSNISPREEPPKCDWALSEPDLYKVRDILLGAFS